jgi:hypothetical protein
MRTSRREVRALLVAAGRRPVPESTRLGVTASVEVDPLPHARPSRRELRAMLRAAGARPVPEISHAFVAFADPHTVSPTGPPVPALALEPRRSGHRARRSVVLTGAAAAAVTVVLVAGLTGIVGGPAADAELALGVAVDTVVVMPDGSTVDGTRGMALPDGAIVRTGPSGRAAAGGVELGPGEEAVVDGRHLVQSAAAQAAPADPVTPTSGAASAPPGAVQEVTAAVDGTGTAPPVREPAAPPDATSNVPPADGAPVVTLPAITTPTVPSPQDVVGSLPGVDPLR